MKANIMLLLFLVSCINDKHLKVGMMVSNGYCKGQISQIGSVNAVVVDAVCGKTKYNWINMPLSDLVEVR